MTTYFVSNAGSNTAPYDTEAKAATTLGVIAALPWAATDVVKVSSTHTETAGAAITYTFPATVGLQILSVVFNGSGTGALTAGAAVNVGAASAAFTINSGFAYLFGLTLAAGTNNNALSDFNIAATAGSPSGIKFDACTLKKTSTTAGSTMFFGAAGNTANDDVTLSFVNCIFNVGGITIQVRCGNMTLDAASFAGTAPTTLFLVTNGAPFILDARGCDLSNAWTNLFDISAATYGRASFSQCRLASGFVVTTGANPGPGQFEINLIDCDSGDNHYTYIRSNWSGTVTASNAKYADASDGTNSFSWLMASSANASFTWPLIAPDITWWNSTLSAMTTTVPVAHNAVGGGTGGVLLNSDMWQITLAKVTSGFTLGSWEKSDRVADIATTGADQDTDGTTTWTGASIGTHDKLVSGSFTPAEVGPIIVSVRLAKASVSVYASPKVLASSSKQWMSPNGTLINEQPSGGFPVLGGPLT